MKTQKEIETLLKQYETRRDNIERKWQSNESWNIEVYDNFLRTVRNYDAKIETVKLILK